MSLPAYFSVSPIACNLQRTHRGEYKQEGTSPAENLQPCCYLQQVASQVNMSWGDHSGNLLDIQEVCGPQHGQSMLSAIATPGPITM